MNKLGIDNLVRLSILAIAVAEDIKRQLADGFQPFSDIPAIAFNDFGKIQEIGKSAKPAWQEIQDLTPDELDELEQRVAAGANLPADGVIGKVRKSFKLAARGYRVVEEVIDIVHDAADIFE